MVVASPPLPPVYEAAGETVVVALHLLAAAVNNTRSTLKVTRCRCRTGERRWVITFVVRVRKEDACAHLR